MTSTIPDMTSDRIYESLRIPPALDSTASVNFVITQEPGKLKPKDLKIAIERNRAEREQRAVEQKRIRDEGGGAGVLDLRGILAEERLNGNESDPFKRQLRELAFLADVEDVEKLEVEKTFRISGDYLGSDFLSQQDIDIVYKQRAEGLLLKKKTDWRNSQSRQKTKHYSPIHPHVKAGTLADVAHKATTTLTPQFDPNQNDIWSKRMTTLRRFISFVSRWLIQKRVTDRIRRVLTVFHNNNAFTREEVLLFIAEENNRFRKSGGKNSLSDPNSSGDSNTNSTLRLGQSDDLRQQPVSLASMVFYNDNESLVKREQNLAIGPVPELTASMCRRVLFPQCLPGSGGGPRLTLPERELSLPLRFDDSSFFTLKTKPEYIVNRYEIQQLPAVPLLLPVCSDKALRIGAPEECFLRSEADSKVEVEELNKLSAGLFADAPLKISSLLLASQPKEEDNDKEDDSLPVWMSEADCWDKQELDFCRQLPQFRVYSRMPRRSEIDCDWKFRPNASQKNINYEFDTSLRTTFCNNGGFLSANTYLFGGRESVSHEPLPPAGPTLSDMYFPDSDRHVSGLHCFVRDHIRGTVERDEEVAPLQSRQDKQDCLTDSESDNEDSYRTAKPSLAIVRQILKPPPPVVKEEVDPKAKGKDKGKGKEKEKEVIPPPQVKVEIENEDDYSVLGDDQRKEEQVELLRDRKTLELESGLLKSRRKMHDEVANRRLEVSKASLCQLMALPVQLPFHQYEEEVYQLLESSGRIPFMQSSFVELDNLSASFSSPTNTLISSPNTFSPDKFGSPQKLK